MGREPGTWITTKGYSVLNEHREDVIRRALARETLESIGELYGTSYTNVHRWLSQETSVYQTMVKCILVECDVMFPFKSTKLACCRKHIKRYCARGGPGELLPCCLPECGELVIVANRSNRAAWWCSRKHGDIHHQRVRNGFYRRLLSDYQRCEGRDLEGNRCSEHICIDEHHTVFTDKGSDKSSPVVYLCSTHHQAIHRGMAVYEGGAYRWIIGEILDGLRSKHPDLGKTVNKENPNG
ncbi:MAG: hypothetical protein AB7L09_03225 [Nitrospira sp.]